MNNLTKEQKTLLLFLHRSFGREALIIPENIDWMTLDSITTSQGVISFAFDGASAMKVDLPPEINDKWKIKTLRGVVKNERLLRAQDEIFGWFTQMAIPAVVLKGSSVSRYYPDPNLRALGDIDILVQKTDLEKVRTLLEQNGYVLHESDHAFHLGFSRKGVYVEIHYAVTSFPDSAGGRVTEQYTSHFLDDICQGVVEDHAFPVLNESNQALALLLHMIRHMFDEGIGLRQLSDWAMYVANADPACFENTTIPMLKDCGLLQYAKVATKCCISYLGLPDFQLRWCQDVDEEASWLFLTAVFNGGNMGSANQDGFTGLVVDQKGMGEKHSSMNGLLTNLTKLAYEHFPFTKKCKVLLPFFWIFLPIRYWVRSLFGFRPQKSVIKFAKTAKQHRDFYEVLDLFEVD